MPRFVTAFLLLATTVFAASVADWRSKSIYQVVTDRFATTDDKGGPCDTDARKYCGGTWHGIINHLDYIQAMGFDAVWISPVVENLENETAYGEAYQGFWTKDMNTLNSHFGTPDDLKALSAALHHRDMYLMVDVLVNHYAAVPVLNTSLPSNASEKNDVLSLDPETFAPMSKSAFHPQCFITDYDNQTQVEECWLGDPKLLMLDIDTENGTNFRMLNSWITDLVTDYEIDGLRIAAAKHIRQDFWKDFKTSAGVFSLGEVLSDNVTYTSGYTQALDGVLDYPTWFTLAEVFSSPTGNFSNLINVVIQSQRAYSTGLVTTGSFVENASQPRFGNLTNDESLIKNAITWPFLHDGIPIVYYGQEQGFSGGSSPHNHEALWSSEYRTYRKPLVKQISALNVARHLAISSGENFLTTAMTFVPQENDNSIAVSKPPLLGLMSNAGNDSTATWSIPHNSGLFLKGESLVDVLTCKMYEVDLISGDLNVTSEYGLPVVIMPSKFLNSDGTLCPTLASRISVSGSSASHLGAPRLLLQATLLFILTFRWTFV